MVTQLFFNSVLKTSSYTSEYGRGTWSHNCSSIQFLKHLPIPVSMEEVHGHTIALQFCS